METGETNILKDTALGKIRSLQHVVILRDTATVEQVLKTLATHRLVSAPVVKDALEKETRHGPTWPMSQAPRAVAGFIDVKTIIKRFLDDIEKAGVLEMRSMLRKMRALDQQGMIFSKKTIREHDLLTGDGSFLHVDQDSLSLLELASEALLGTSRRTSTIADLPNVVHRIAVFDSQERIVNIISQSDIVRYLLENCEELGKSGQKTVGELGFGRTETISVLPELSAIEALRVMDGKNVGAVAVVSKEGRIIGNFSAADMRTMTSEHFGSLALPVGEFLALEHGVEYSGYAIARKSSDSSSSGELPSTRRLNHNTSVDFLEQRIPIGSDTERAVLQFARETPGRVKRSPGEDVGQTLVVCSLQDTLNEVMRMLNDGRVHRVFIVDDDVKPIGVITCTDILRTLVDIYH